MSDETGPLKPQLRLLIELDQLDRSIQRALERRDELRQAVKAFKAGLAEEKAKIQAKEAEKNSLHTARLKDEHLLYDAEKKLKRIRDFSHVTSQKELEAAQREVEALTVQKGTLEENILVALDRLEGLEGEIKSARNIHVSNKRQAADTIQKLREEFDTLGTEIDTQRTARDRPIQELPPELREEYLRLMRRYKDRAMVTVVDDMCPPCQTKVPAQHVVNTLLGKSFHICQYCERLILPEQVLINC